MKTHIDSTGKTVAALVSGGKDEMNFAEFPTASVSEKVQKGQRSIQFEDQVFDHKTKRYITRRCIIEGSEKYGLPTATDDLVILALIQLSKIKNFEKDELEFTRLELIEMLGWKDDGKSYKRLKESLFRIKLVNYIYDNAWWDNDAKAWTSRAFSIIDNVEINDSRSAGQDGLFPSRIVWNEVVFKSFADGFIRDIDFQLCLRLKHSIALRMYRFMGKTFHREPDKTFELKEFAINHMGLGQKYEGGAGIARKLRPAIKELETEGFLEPLPDSERFTKKGRDWSIRLIQKGHAQAALPEPNKEPHSSAEPTPLAMELIQRGVTEKTAADFVAKISAELLQAKIDVFDWMKERKDKRIGKSPAGYLVASINGNYAIPEGYISSAERERRAAATRQSESQAAESRRLKRAAEAKEQAIKARVAAYRKALTVEQLARLEADAIAQADEESRGSLNDPAMKPFKKTLIHRMTDEHIARLIEAEPEPA